MYRCTVAILLLLVVVATVTVAKPRIVGGQDAHRGQFPHQVAMRLAGQYLCSGSIIASRWILTTAYCLPISDTSKYTIDAGALRLDSDGQSYQVNEIIMHEDFDSDSIINNVALLRLSEDIAFDENVKAIAFNGPAVGGQEPAVISGWGYTTVSGPNPKVMQFTNTTTITNEECKQLVGELTDSVDDNSICISWGSAGHGSCIGDLGDPLLVNGQLAGMLSWSVNGCAVGYPDVYTRVSSYVQWINDKIGE